MLQESVYQGHVYYKRVVSPDDPVREREGEARQHLAQECAHTDPDMSHVSYLLSQMAALLRLLPPCRPWDRLFWVHHAPRKQGDPPDWYQVTQSDLLNLPRAGPVPSSCFPEPCVQCMALGQASGKHSVNISSSSL